MGSSKKQTVGFWYPAIFHHGLCIGPIDAFLEFRAGGQTAWSGEITESDVIAINKPNLWGGKKDQGGVIGDLHLLFGEEDQQPSSLLAEQFGDQQPGWRGLSTIIYNGRYGSGNPYPQKPAYKVKQIKAAWECWYEAKAEIILSTASTSAQTSVVIADTAMPGTSAYIDDSNGLLVEGFGVDDTCIVDLPYGLSYLAWSHWETDENPGAGGLPWTCRFKVTDDVDSVDTYLDTFYSTVSAAFQSAQLATPIEMTGSTSYLFWLDDDPSDDNRGGLSLRIQRRFTPRAMNPAHILYYMHTVLDAGGYDVSTIDDTSFTAGADWYFDNNFGLCAEWDPAQESVEEFQQRIQNIASCSISRDIRDGKWYLDVANGEYDLESLPILTDDDILSFEEKPTLIDSAKNSVSIKYFDPDKKETITTAPVEAHALIEEYGRNHLTLVMPEVPTAELAIVIAQRELQQRIAPLRGFNLTTTRLTYAWRTNTYFRLQSPKRGIADMVCLLNEKSSGTLKSGAIKITAMQDIFAFPTAVFVEQEIGVDTGARSLEAIQDQAVFETPYFDLAGNLPRADLEALLEDVGYLQAVAVDPAVSFDFDMHVDTGGGYLETVSGNFCPTLTIVEEVDDPLETSFTFDNGQNLSELEVGAAALWGDEIRRLDAIDREAGTIELAPGCADTVPRTHAAGSRVYFWQDYSAADPTEYLDEETVSIKLLTDIGTDVLPLAAATPLELTFNQRWYRPYPPAGVQVNGQAYPDPDAPLAGKPTATWVYRDRLLQADQLIDTTEAGIGPEVGTTVTVEYYTELGVVPIDSETGIVGNSATPWDAPEDGKYRLEIFTVRDGLESWQRQVRVISTVSLLWNPSALAVPPKVWVDWGSGLVESGGAVSEWNNDKGSQGGSWDQSTGSAQPAVMTTGLNGKRFLEFDGSSDYLEAGGGTILDFARNTDAVWLFTLTKQNVTGIFNGHIAQWSEGTSDGGRFGVMRSHSSGVGVDRLFARRTDGGGSDSVSYGTAYDDTDWHMTFAMADYTDTEGTIVTDGGAPTVDASFLTAGNTSDTASQVAIMGAPPSLGSRSNISIALIVGGSGDVLSLDEQQRLEGWAAHQCGLTGSLPGDHPFKTAPPYVATPVLQPSFASDPTVFGFEAAAEGSDIGLAAGPVVSVEFGVLFNAQPSLAGGEGITVTSDGVDISVRLDGLTPASTPAQAVIYDLEGSEVATVTLTDQTGYFDGTQTGVLEDGEVYYVSVESV